MYETRVVKADEFPKVPFFIEGVSSRFIRHNRVIPVEFDSGVLRVIMVDPRDTETIDALRLATNASEVAVSTAAESDVEEYLSRFYEREPEKFEKLISDIGGAEFDAEQDVSHLKDIASEAPVIRLVNMVLSRAIESRASDVHIEPYEEELRVRYRIDGVLHDVETVPKKLQAAITSRVKIMARLNIAERRLPQDGRIRINVRDRELDIRVSTIPVIYGESLVLRILDRGSMVIDLDSFGFMDDTLRAFKSLIAKPHGIILVTGPTGSGKTTTLYGALKTLNSPERKIITVEDPVEYQIKGINQIHVKPQIGLGFASALRHIVRQDPDVIMIGEIRDLETAEIAIQSALTGHLVFSTLHTNDAPSSITRLLDMGVENYLLVSTLVGVLAQRLVRNVCPYCREKDPNAVPGISGLEGADIYRGRGCEKCSNTGFFGRTGIFELMAMDDELGRATMRSADASELRTIAAKRGMRSLLDDGREKIRSGVTTPGEVLRVTEEA